MKNPVHNVAPSFVTGSHDPRALRPGILSSAREKRLSPTPPATALKGRLVRVERSNEKVNVLAIVQRINPVASAIRPIEAPGEKVAVAIRKGVVC